MSPIRVLLVDDSPSVVASMRRLLAQAPDIQVVGSAKDGLEALDLVTRLSPQVVCTDLRMPGLDGLGLTEAIMATDPRPILVVSGHLQEDENRVFQLLEAGAVDVFPKPGPDTTELQEHWARELASKIRILAGVRVFRRRPRAPAALPTPAAAGQAHPRVRMVAIGASTGGPQALTALLSQVPRDFPAPILVVQHISQGFLEGLVEWLDHRAQLRVKIATEGETPQEGTIYFPPEGAHLEVDAKGRLALAFLPAVDGHRPSITHTMQSVARHYGAASLGVLLTGMGSDGAEGMRAIAEAGGVTIAQDESTSIVFGMPARAIALGAAKYVLPLGEIPRRLVAETRATKQA
jgi:two-component system chemotaxis response regulator CheB